MYLLQETMNFPCPTQLASAAADLCTEHVIGLGDLANMKFDISISFENKANWEWRYGED